MRFLVFIILFFTFHGLLHTQTVQVDYVGDPISQKDHQKIEQMLRYEVKFYSQFGLPDTLSLQMHVFKRKMDGIAYLAGKNIFLHRSIIGMYSPSLNKAFILGWEDGREKTLGVIYHELSHHFTRKITNNHPPIWLNEGLAEFFEHCKINKKGIEHTLTEYEQGRIRTMYMLDEINLSTFVNKNNKQFLEQEYTDEQYSYILSHALVTFWIERVPNQILKDFISALQDPDDRSTIFQLIDRIYPKGFKQFEQDFKTFCE